MVGQNNFTLASLNEEINSNLFMLNKSGGALSEAEAEKEGRTLFLLGEKWELGGDFPIDFQQALMWYVRASKLGNTEAQARLLRTAQSGDVNGQYCLAKLLETGLGLKQNYIEAANWYKEAANRGSAGAAITFAAMFENGRGVPQDYKEAEKWYLQAADLGLAEALYGLGRMYENSQNTPISYEKAARCYREAAEKGDYNRILNFTHYCGNREETVVWWENSAEQGEPDAQFHLGLKYYLGEFDDRKTAEGHLGQTTIKALSFLYQSSILRNQKAVEWWTKAADQGHPNAQYALGRMYMYDDTGDLQSWVDAAKWYINAAEKGNANAQYAMGKLCESENTEEAAKWYRKSAEQGHAKAQYAIGYLLERGDGVTRSGKEALMWLLESAKQGFMEAHESLARMYEEGNGVPQNYKEAVKWHLELAKNGFPDSQFALARFYTEGQVLTEDPYEAAKWCYHAARNGHDEAQFMLGCFYREGKGVKKDLNSAIEWFKKSAERGHVEASYELGSIYENGEGVSIDIGEAAKWYREASKRDHCKAASCFTRVVERRFAKSKNDIEWLEGANNYDRDDDEEDSREPDEKYREFWHRKAVNQAKAMCELGYKFKYGINVEQSHEMAVACYQKAANQGCIEAQLSLGCMYAIGECVPQNIIKSTKWLMKAAEQSGYAPYKDGFLFPMNDKIAKWWFLSAENGSADAQFGLGLLFFFFEAKVKIGRKSGWKTALYWWGKSAEKGYPPAQHALGCVYKTGKCVKKNYKEAARWYRKAAKQGYVISIYELGRLRFEHSKEKAAKLYLSAAKNGIAKAQYDLGCMYEEGIGISQFSKKAKFWYQQAAKKGYVAAKIALSLMCPSETMARGYKLLKRLLPKNSERWSPSILYALGCVYENSYEASDKQEAANWYRKAAGQGHAGAQHALGRMYENGDWLPINHAEAVRWYRNAAEQGNPEAQYALGRLYENGLGEGQNYDEALLWYQRSANQGLTEAQFALGHLYENGRGVSRDYKKAAQYFCEAVAKNFDPGYHQNACFKASKEAVAWWRKSAEEGDADAQFCLGLKYFRWELELKPALDDCKEIDYDEEFSKDSDDTEEKNRLQAKEAAFWWLKAAEHGHVSAQYCMGYFYENICFDDDEKIKWYLKSANLGNLNAQYALGRIFEYDDGNEGERWYLKCEEKGLIKAQSALGDWYMLRQKDGVNAFKWYLKAAKNGSDCAQNAVGKLYEEGLGVAQSNDKAARWYLEAAKQGDTSGVFALERMLADGKIIPSGYESIEKCPLKNIEEYMLGRFYEVGKRLHQDYIESAKCYQKAAEQGNHAAQHALGLAFFDGKGVPQNFAEAYFWLNIASINNPDWIEKRDIARKKISPAKREEIQARCRSWNKQFIDSQVEAIFSKA